MERGAPQFESADNRYKMESWEIEAMEKTVAFAHDPIEYLQNHIEIIAQMWPEEDIAFAVIDEIEERNIHGQMAALDIKNEDLSAYIQHRDKPEGSRALSDLLIEVGITHKQLNKWLEEKLKICLKKRKINFGNLLMKRMKENNKIHFIGTGGIGMSALT